MMYCMCFRDAANSQEVPAVRGDSGGDEGSGDPHGADVLHAGSGAVQRGDGPGEVAARGRAAGSEQDAGASRPPQARREGGLQQLRGDSAVRDCRPTQLPPQLHHSTGSPLTATKPTQHIQISCTNVQTDTYLPTNTPL